MNIKLHPSTVSGTVKAPPSKSSGQRLLLLSLSKEKTIIEDLGQDADTQAMLTVLKELPLQLENKDEQLLIQSEWQPNVESIGYWQDSLEVDIGESGFALRSLMFVLPLFSKHVIMHQQGTLQNRDFTEIIPLLKALGVEVKFKPEKTILKGILNLEAIKSLERWPALQSSQYLSGFLILVSLLIDWKLLEIDEVAFEVDEVKSLPYVFQTIEHLEITGHVIPVFNQNKIKFSPSVKASNRWVVDKDWSSAALLLAAGVSTSQEFSVAGLDLFRTQADKKILEALQDMGMQMSIRSDEIELRYTSIKNAFQIDATHCPDLFPALAVMASCCEGTSVIEGVHRLKNKESDRSQAIVESFQVLGIDIKIQDDLMIIKGGKPQGGVVHSFKDHRMAMALSILAMRSEDIVEVRNAEVIKKSYPEFFEDLTALGLQFEVSNEV